MFLESNRPYNLSRFSTSFVGKLIPTQTADEFPWLGADYSNN